MIIVQKYGGTSLSGPEQIKAVAQRIVREKKAGRDVVVVVSAMGEDTDKLLSLARSVSSSPEKRELDMLLTSGERKSMALLAMAIHDLGFESTSFTGSQVGIITDARHTRAKVLEVKGKRLQEALKKGEIVIVAGFQGVSPEKEVTTLGRGGSDITAVVLAAYLKAKRCEIFTDVDGVYSADPKIAPNAMRLSEISYEEMMELSRNGFKVIHSEAVEIAALNRIELQVSPSLSGSERSESENIESQGTLIRESKRLRAKGAKKHRLRKSSPGELTDLSGLIRGIASDDELTLLTLSHVPRNVRGFSQIVSTLADEGMHVRFFYHGAGNEKTVDLSFLIASEDLTESVKILERVSKRLKAKGMRVREDVASLSIVGSGIGNSSFLLSRIFDSLASLGIHIETVSTSETKVTCIVPKRNVKKAVKSLVKEFGLEEK
jgi:aspartate kinase